MINTNVNAIMTIIGFAVSILFIIFLCTRLLCARLHLRGPRTALQPSALTDFGVLQRGINGMEPSVVATFPTVKYNHQNFASREDIVCTVCLGEYEERDVLRVLPNCGHVFHINCIDLWLRQNSTCPVCRVSLRDSCIGESMQSPVPSMAAQLSYVPGAVSESGFGHSLNSSRELQSTFSALGPEQPVIPLILEANQCGSVRHELDESTSERNMYCVTEDNCGRQDLRSLQLNDTDSGGDQFAPGILAQNMIYERPKSHGLWLQKGFEEVRGAVETLGSSYSKDSIPWQCDSSKATGISSSSQAQNSVTVASPDGILEGPSWLSRFQMTLIASGVLVNAVSSSVSGRQKDGSVSMEASGRSETLNKNSIPFLIEGVRNVIDDNLSFCEITLAERRSMAVDDTSSDGSSLAAHTCRDFADPHRILERNFIIASREYISDSVARSLTSSSAEVHRDMPERSV